MGIRKVLSAVFLAAIMVFSCGSGPDKTRGEVSEKSGGVSEKNAKPAETFDPTRVSQALYTSTRDEVRQFIENLNRMIRSRDYESWKACLSKEYFAEISSQKNLSEISAQPAMKTRRIVLKVPEDYFQYVVVPSRADLRVDDIEFISSNRVKAFTITMNRAGEEVRLRLYDLEKIGNSWTIIN